MADDGTFLGNSLGDLGADNIEPRTEATLPEPSADDDAGLSLEQYLEQQIRALGGDTDEKGERKTDAEMKEAVQALKRSYEDAPEEDDDPPGVGAVVELVGLTTAGMNGLQGTVTRHQNDRVVVELPEPWSAKALRPINLKIIAPPPPEGAAVKRARVAASLPPGAPPPTPTELQEQPGLYEPAIRYWDTFTPQSRILVVGEGNYSWAWNLCHILGTGENMVCTDAAMNATVPQTCNQYLLPLVEAGATISMKLDATRMGKQVLVRRCGGYFNFVVWNFPHTTTPNKAPHSQEEHRQLLTRFLQQAELVLDKGGKASITVKDGYPYNEWRIAELSPGGRMKYVGCEVFSPERFAIYAHVTTRAGAGINGSSQIARVFPAHTYVYECQ